jgi:hypothetical protein
MSKIHGSKIRNLLIAAAAAAGIVTFAGMASAYAGTPPAGSNLPVSISVSTPTISLLMASQSVSLSVQPGSSATAATPVTYSVASQVPYEVTVAAPDLTSGSNVLLASNLSDGWSESNQAGTVSGMTPLAEGDAPAVTYSSGAESSHGGSGGADSFSDLWSITAPGAQATGTYSTVVSYVAQAN